MSATSAQGHAKIKELPLGKIRRYSSLEDEFKPLSSTMTSEKLDGMVSRLYTPDLLRQRTAVDLARRQEVARSRYNSLEDRHLSNYWCRLRGRQITRNEAKRVQALELDQIVASNPELAAAFYSGSPAPRVTPRSRPRTVTPRGGPLSPIAAVSPAASNNTEALALMASSNVQTENTTPKKQLAYHRGSQTGTISPLLTVCWQCICDFLPHTDAQSLGVTCFRLRQIVCQCRGWPPPDSPRSAEDEEAPAAPARRQRAVLLDVDDPSMHEEEQRKEAPPESSDTMYIQRKDLTALWMLADPPPHFMGCVQALNLSPGDYDLIWLRAPHGRPDPSVSIFSIPESAAEECTGFRLNSPRSIICMLRNGVFLDDLLPRPLHAYYREGILHGALPRIAEKRFAVRETRRQQTLAEMKRLYGSLCSQVSQAHVIQFLRTVCPKEHPDMPIRHDHMKMTNATVRRSTLQKKLSIISLNEIRQEEITEEKRMAATNRFEMYVRRNLQSMMERVKKIRVKEIEETHKTVRRNERDRQEAEMRREMKIAHDKQVEQVLESGKILVEHRRNEVLKKIADQEKECEKIRSERSLAHQVEQEEKNLLQQQMLERRIRHERTLEYHRLSVADRFRRKMDKCEAATQSKAALLKKLKLAREKSALETEELAKKHQAEVLAFQRREYGRHPVESQKSAQSQEISRDATVQDENEAAPETAEGASEERANPDAEAGQQVLQQEASSPALLDPNSGKAATPTNQNELPHDNNPADEPAPSRSNSCSSSHSSSSGSISQ